MSEKPWFEDPNSAVAFCVALEALLSDEGNEVSILCENPEGTGPDNRAVEAVGDWTGWERKRFYGHTPLDAILAAGIEQARAR